MSGSVSRVTRGVTRAAVEVSRERERCFWGKLQTRAGCGHARPARQSGPVRRPVWQLVTRRHAARRRRRKGRGGLLGRCDFAQVTLRRRMRRRSLVSRDSGSWLHAALSRGSSACSDAVTVNDARAGSFSRGCLVCTCGCVARFCVEVFCQMMTSAYAHLFLGVRLHAPAIKKDPRRP